VISEIIIFFFFVSSLESNLFKYIVHYFGIQGGLLNFFMEFYPYKLVDLKLGFRYMGYFLKDDNYKTEDWLWLISKFEKRIDHWCDRWLYLGG